jgi:hypothetical protein
VERSLSDGQKVDFPRPDRPIGVVPDGSAAGTAPVIDSYDKDEWNLQMRMALTAEALLNSNLASAYTLIKGQCSKPILEKVEAQHGYGAVHDARDSIKLLALIKAVMFNYNSRKYRPAALVEIMESIFVPQTEYMSDSEYLEKFRTRMDVLKSAGGDLCVHPGMVQDELDRTNVGPAAQASDFELAIATLATRGRMEGALFLAKSYQQKYRPLVQDLANDFKKGHDSYPDTLTAAYELMLHDVRGSGSQLASQGNPGMAFSTVGESGGQLGTPATRTQPNPRADVTCHKCNKVGHFSNKCADVIHANGTVLCRMVAEVVDVESPEEGVIMAHFGSVVTGPTTGSVLSTTAPW